MSIVVIREETSVAVVRVGSHVRIDDGSFGSDAPTGGSSKFAELLDVDIDDVEDGDAMVWDADQGKVVPGQAISDPLWQFTGHGPPPLFIPGAQAGDIYLDLDGLDLYELV